MVNIPKKLTAKMLMNNNLTVKLVAGEGLEPPASGL